MLLVLPAAAIFLREKVSARVIFAVALGFAGVIAMLWEGLTMPGKGAIQRTGQLGEVMKESIDAASSFVRSVAPELGIRPPEFEKRDIHVHVPEGATPKEGPSAGSAMVTSIVSTLTGIPIRREVAMTGEVTLRGRVLPIGGLKEKLLAALRGGIKTVLIPIPGTSKTIRCNVALLAFGGGCGISDPNMQDVETDGRPPPDVPFKPELHEDQDGLRRPAPADAPG